MAHAAGFAPWVALASTTLVATHFALSHPLRRPLVARVGERGFLGLYSAVALAALAWIGLAYRAAGAEEALWPVGDGLWAAASAVMLGASILLAGSLVGNPALPTGGAASAVPARATGAFAVTRHPMMWAFALWGGCHIAVYPTARNIDVALGIILLALVGAALQDGKKRTLEPARWSDWEARTSYWPFAAVVAGRARLAGFGWPVLLGGAALWLAATWAHIPLAGWRAGVWRWIG